MANKIYKAGSSTEYIYDSPNPSHNMLNIYLTASNESKGVTNKFLSTYNSSLFNKINGDNGFLLKADAPVNVSDLLNDAGYQTSTDVASAIATALDGFTSINFDIVPSLPATGVSGTIYLVANSGTGNNTYDEYVYLSNVSRFEKIGTTDIDLSNYLQSSKVVSKGSATNPVYFDSTGEAQATTYQLNKTVPADAVFTDTTYSQGTGININASNEISNAGVRGVSEGSTNGTISVNTNGTSAEVTVHGLGTMAFENVTDFASSSDAVTSVAEGSGNGQIAVTKDGTTTQVDVHGLGSAAYTSSTDYATSDHNHNTDYASINHNHDTEYASINHNHDSEYASINHNHDTDYAAIDHNHDTEYAAIDHTHNYAGSASAGGSANSAVRLDDANVGSATQGVYIDANGTPSAMTYQLNKTVPADAVFTDTTYSQGTGITIDANNVISTDGEANVQADWNETDTTDDAYIQNKPTLGTASAKDFTTSVTSESTDLITSGAVYTGLDAKLDKTSVGSASGVAELDSSGKVPASQLPSYVDDVVEGYLHTDGKFYEEAAHTTEITGESSKIYVDLATDLTYRWSGSAFVEISQGIALGETSSTAYRGDRGKTAYDHSQLTSGNPHNVSATDVGLGDVVNTGDSDIPVSGGTTKFTTGGAYTELAKKQDVLTEGDNIDISVSGVISAIDTTYTQGTGIEITGAANAINLTSSTLASLAKADTALQSSDLVFATDADIEALFAN